MAHNLAIPPKETPQTKLQFTARKDVEEKQLNCEQCGEPFSGVTHLEEHGTIIHDFPEEVLSGKQVNVSSNVIEAKTNIGEIISQNIAEKEIKQYNCETEGKQFNIRSNICGTEKRKCKTLDFFHHFPGERDCMNLDK